MGRRAHREAALPSEKAHRAFDWAETQLEERGSYIIVVARFIPSGAPLSRSPPATRTGCRGTGSSATTSWRALVWATYATMLGYIGGKQFEEQPWKGVLLGLAIAFSVAFSVEWIRKRARRARSTGGVTRGPRSARSGRAARREPEDARASPRPRGRPLDCASRVAQALLRPSCAACVRCSGEPPRGVLEPVPAPARREPRRLVSLGRRGVRAGAASDRPLLVSVGYSSCHWCHVMEHESFSDQTTAALMNELFVNVKVDREERPDVDALTMEACVTMTGQGGWPTTVFLTPEGRPFYAGRTSRPSRATGCPASGSSSRRSREAWRERRDDLEAQAERLVGALGGAARLEAGDEPLSPTLLDAAERGLARDYEPAFGGFGGRRSSRRRRRSSSCCAAADRGARDGRAHARRDGGRRPLRRRRRRLPPLLGRRAAGSCRTSRRCSTTTRCSPRRTSTPGS